MASFGNSFFTRSHHQDIHAFEATRQRIPADEGSDRDSASRPQRTSFNIIQFLKHRQQH
jgi:hypothetical protein